MPGDIKVSIKAYIGRQEEKCSRPRRSYLPERKNEEERRESQEFFGGKMLESISLLYSSLGSKPS